MSRFRFELATPADDADLRHVLSQTPMDGQIAITLKREPSWFSAAVVDGQQRQVVVCRDVESSRIIGFGCRSIRKLYVDGQPQVVGYLSSLRVLAEHRSRGLVARGFAYFRRLHMDRQTPYYLTTIAKGNVPAIQVLTSARAGLPRYMPAGLYHTYAIPFAKGSRVDPTNGVTVSRATTDDIPRLVQFLNSEGRRRRFFPVVEEADLFTNDGPWSGLNLEDLWLASKKGELAGVLGAWDQHAFKQCVVVGYRGPLGWLRPAINAWNGFRRLPRLPAVGSSLRFRVAAIPIVQNDASDVLEMLLSYVVDAYAGDLCTHFLFGLHECDPLLAVVRRRSVACYSTHLYLVSWEDEATALAISSGIPYLELGTL